MTRVANQLLILAVILLLGCADNKSPTPKAAPQATNEKQEVTPEPDPPAEPATEILKTDELEESDEGTDLVTESPPPAERILLLARGGPLLVDIWLTIDGQPFTRGIDALIDTVVDAGDTDEDGRATWAEWRANEDFLQGELANLNPIRQRTHNDWVKRYDENSDGSIQRGEAAAWLGRNGGRSATALRVRSSRSYAAMGAAQSRLWQILDHDEDASLSRDELKLASQRLLLLDTSDDRIVDAAELATLRDQLSSQTGQRSRFARQSRRDAAIHLQGHSDASALDYTLSDLYAPRQQIGPSSFPARSRLFAELDADRDQELSGGEFEAMLSVEPHLKLGVDFVSESDDDEPRAKLTILEQSVEIEQVLQTSDSRFVIVTTDTRLIFSAQDLRPREAENSTVQANQISLMVHDRGDGLFECLDANANGNLGEREIMMAADQILESDANGDRQLAGDELPYFLTVAFLRGEAQNERSFYVPSVNALPAQQSDAPAWFLHADLNADGDISRTEFLGSLGQFESLDKNRDQFVSAQEAATSEHP